MKRRRNRPPRRPDDDDDGHILLLVCIGLLLQPVFVIAVTVLCVVALRFASPVL